MAIISEKEMEIIVKIARGFSSLSEFDKGYFLGVVEAKAEAKKEVVLLENKKDTAARKEVKA